MLPLALGQTWNQNTRQDALKGEMLENEQWRRSGVLAAVSWEAACPADLDFAERKVPRLSGSKQTGWAEARARPRLAVFPRPVFASISNLHGPLG